MKFSDLKQTILAQFMVPGGNRIVPFIEGKPGGGKSACAREIVAELKKQFNIADQQIIEFNPSLRDPVDVLGIPFKHESGTHNVWLPPEEFYNLREGVGYCALIIEELTDAPMSMQNPMCRIILDRWAGSVKLSDKLFIIATGNRVEDKSGASRMSTKLGNRLRCLPFDENLDDWIVWARENKIDEVLIKFLQFQPKLLSDFDPTRKTNPTPRSWASVSLIPEFEGSGKAKERLFQEVVAVKPTECRLTSFSVLFAAYKGDIYAFTEGAKALEHLNESSRILIAEACTHAPASEDIGRVKIPRMLRRRFGDGLGIDIVGGTDFPDDLFADSCPVHSALLIFHGPVSVYFTTFSGTWKQAVFDRVCLVAPGARSAF